MVEWLLSWLRSSKKQTESFIGQRYDASIYSEWGGIDYLISEVVHVVPRSYA